MVDEADLAVVAVVATSVDVAEAGIKIHASSRSHLGVHGIEGTRTSIGRYTFAFNPPSQITQR